MNSRSQWFFGPYTSENTNGPLRGEAGKPSCSFRRRSAAAWCDSPIIRCEEGGSVCGSTSTANFMWSRHVREASMARNLYFLGTAGSGKSTMVYAFQLWMNSQGLDCVTVNLDPGAESLQYSPDLDVRDYVNLSEIMEEQDLGPNGA